MKTNKYLCLLLTMSALLLGLPAHATIYNVGSGTLDTPITDGSTVGIVSSLNETAAPDHFNRIESVAVQLNISGGYNGDLIGYLVLQDADGHTATTILLNRVGTSSGDPFGSEGSGFNVTLSDAGTVNGDIHNAGGNPTGNWLADQSAGANSLNSTFGGMNANGTWSLYLTDMSSGGQSTLQSWNMEISAVPEPITIALILFAGLVIVGRKISGLPRVRKFFKRLRYLGRTAPANGGNYVTSYCV